MKSNNLIKETRARLENCGYAQVTSPKSTFRDGDLICLVGDEDVWVKINNASAYMKRAGISQIGNLTVLRKVS